MKGRKKKRKKERMKESEGERERNRERDIMLRGVGVNVPPLENLKEISHKEFGSKGQQFQKYLKFNCRSQNSNDAELTSYFKSIVNVKSFQLFFSH